MKLKYNPIVHDISGKIGGGIYARWKGIPYVRSHTLQRNPATPAQKIVRDKYSLCAYFYKMLSTSTKRFWDAYRPGLAMSGYNHWFTQNRSPSDPYHLNLTAPHNPDIPPIIQLSAVKGPAEGWIELTWAGGPWPDDYVIDLYAYGYNINQWWHAFRPGAYANDYHEFYPFGWSMLPLRIFVSAVKPDLSASGESDAAYTPV